MCSAKVLEHSQQIRWNGTSATKKTQGNASQIDVLGKVSQLIENFRMFSADPREAKLYQANSNYDIFPPFSYRDLSFINRIIALIKYDQMVLQNRLIRPSGSLIYRLQSHRKNK